MDMSELIERTKQNIWQAISDYGEHTRQTSVMDDCTDSFVSRLAHDSCLAKQELRKLFSKSPVWDADLDALVINGTRTHDPDSNRIYSLGLDILAEAICRADTINRDAIYRAIYFFCDPLLDKGISAIKQLAPKAYAPNKKKSRIFKALCKELGVVDETAGSNFQRLYAQFADELTSNKIGFKLYVSINPAHFITMSNPKGDERGATLTSCHSFNSTEYNYNSGCTGYARDDVSFIAFTVADPADRETLNNRKTTRQVFAYKPGNGLLLQSRMYNTSGGVYGASENSKLYRDLIQREISMLENVPNLWTTYPTVGEKSFCVECGDGFGGYPDWDYASFDGKVSIRADHECDFERLIVGRWGLCVSCGCETSDGVYCDECGEGEAQSCDSCGGRAHDLCSVRDQNGNWIEVCNSCRYEYYTYCDKCHEFWPNDCIVNIDGNNYCGSCISEYFTCCSECYEYNFTDDMTTVITADGSAELVCDECLRQYYEECDDCGDYYEQSDMLSLTQSNGSSVWVCQACSENHTSCPHCGSLIDMCADGTCPDCGAVIEEKEEEEAV